MTSDDTSTSTAQSSGVLVAVVGPSGVGKDSILQAAARALSANRQVVFVRRVITRVADETEDHQAVDDAAFEQMAAGGSFALTWEAHRLRYGLPSSISDDVAAGRTVVTNVSRTVIQSLRAQFRRVLVVSIEAPEHVLAARLQARGRESETARAGRLARNVGGVAADVRIDNGGSLDAAVGHFIDALTAVSPTSAQPVAARYAIYLAPPPSSPLWNVACNVIGYDAATGARCSAFRPDGMTQEQWTTLTRGPSTYGFHATLKAPFRLAPHQTLSHLIERLAAFTAQLTPLSLGPLAVRAIRGQAEYRFVALVPTEPPPDLRDLEHAVVSQFDDFRAPLTDADYRRRKPVSLTPRQGVLLRAYGYPYVLDEFRCHFTLTGATELAPQIASALQRHFEDTCGPMDYVADALVLFEQPAPDAPFRIIRRFPFGAVA